MLGLHDVRTSCPLNLRKLLIFVAFPLVYPQTIVRFEGISTKITLESVFSLLWQSDTRLNTSFRYRVLPLFQESFLAPGISLERRRAWLLLGLARCVRGRRRELNQS